MADTSLLVDGFDLGTLNVVVEKVTGRTGDINSTPQIVTVPGRIGEVVVATAPNVGTRKLSVDLAAIADSRTALLAVLDELKWRLSPQKLHTFVWVDDQTRECYGYVADIRDNPIEPDLLQRATKYRVTIECPDPREYATSDTTVSSIGATPVDLTLGSAPSVPTITVTGAGTFTLTYKNSAATTLKTVTVTGATAPVVLDCDAGTVTDAGGNAVPYLSSTSDFPFSFDPQDGDPYAGTPDWPTLECSSGSAEAVYRKAWW
jgi:phage-related protein